MFSKIKKLYKKVKFKNNLGFGNNIDNNILNFGFICPGAIKTLKYLEKNKSKIKKGIFEKLVALTDLLFFIEIIFIYQSKRNIDEKKQHTY